MDDTQKIKIGDCLNLNVLFLKISTAWPGDVSKSHWKNSLYKFYKLFARLLSIFCTLGITLYCFFAYETLEDLTENLSVFGTQIALLGRLIAIGTYEKDFYYLIETLPKNFFVHTEDYVNTKEIATIISGIKYVRRITISLMTLYLFTTITMIFHPLVTFQSEKQVTNSTQSIKRILPFESWYPYVTQETPQYEIQYTLQAILTVLEGLYVGSMDTFCFALLVYFALQFQLLNDSLRNMSNNIMMRMKLETAKQYFGSDRSSRKELSQSVEEENNFMLVQGLIAEIENVDLKRQLESHERNGDEEKKVVPTSVMLEGSYLECSQQDINMENLSYLKSCISHHQSLLGYARVLFKFYNPIFFMQTAISTGLICLLGFQIIVMNPQGLKIVRVILHLVCCIFQLWIFCWLGSNLMYESADLFHAAYECNWYDQSTQFKNLLRLVFIGAAKPVQPSAGLLGSVSLPLFASIMRSSYSYLTILRQFNEDN